jgi:hypothetical protein
MPIGPGKYDHLCTYVREATQASTAIVIVIGGNNGSGFSIQSLVQLPPDVVANLLDQVSKEIRDSMREKQ